MNHIINNNGFAFVIIIIIVLSARLYKALYIANWFRFISPKIRLFL